MTFAIPRGDLGLTGRALAIPAKRRRGAAAHAEPVMLDPALSGDAALQRIGLACLDHVSRNEAAVLAGRADGIHQMRVAVRRLRAILSAFGELLPHHQRHWASEELRWLADTLGPARNLDVFETGLLKPALPDSDNAVALKQLNEAVRCRRPAASDDAAEAVRSTRYTALMRCLSGWFDSYGWREAGGSASLRRPIGEIAERVLQRRWQVARKRHKAFGAQSPGERHRLRIALKKLRYTAEPLASLYSPEKAELLIRRVKRLQDDLGRANDLRVGHQILAELALLDSGPDPIAEAGQRMLAWHAERLAASEPKLRKHLDELFATEPFWRR